MWYKVKLGILLQRLFQCFEHATCIAIDIYDVLGNE